MLDAGVNLTLASSFWGNGPTKADIREGVVVANVLRSRVDTGDQVFAANREAMLTALAEIDRLQAQVVAGGGSADAEKNARSVAPPRSQ